MDKKREIELKPCPHCGGTDLIIYGNGIEKHSRRGTTSRARLSRSLMPSLTRWKNWQERRRKAAVLRRSVRRICQ